MSLASDRSTAAASPIPVTGDVAEHLPPPLFRVAGCRVESELAAGGLAVLYRGIQDSLARPVAIKALRSDVLSDTSGPDWPARFVREAMLLGQLQHENLVQVYDLVDERPQGGSLFIIMELCVGRDLLDIIEAQKRRRLATTFPAPLVATIGLQVARALSAVHAQGIVHRDLKPANILLTRQGVVKLVDFGAAWDPENPRDVAGLEPGLGTPSYMSPEQACGESLDGRSDQFALGAVLYQLLTGSKPFVERSGQSLLAQVIAAPPTALPQRPDPSLATQLAALVGRLLSRRPEQRYADTDDLVRELSQVVGSLPQRRLLQDFLDQQQQQPTAS